MSTASTLPMDIVNMICVYASHLDDSPWALRFDVATGTMKRVFNKYSTNHAYLTNCLRFKMENPSHRKIMLVFNLRDKTCFYVRADVTLLQEQNNSTACNFHVVQMYYLKGDIIDDVMHDSVIVQYTTHETLSFREPRPKNTTEGSFVINSDYDNAYDIYRVTSWQPVWNLPWQPILLYAYDTVVYIS